MDRKNEYIQNLVRQLLGRWKSLK